MSPNENTVIAEPSKEFFVDMITRDISLAECIFDLIDNATHSLINSKSIDVMDVLTRKSKVKRIRNTSVRVTFTDKGFAIEDNCGGISIEDAKDGVFRFGNPNRDTKNPGLGVYGIGMKRAMYKIGENVSIESATTSEQWKVDIDVKKWKSQELWDHVFTYSRKKRSAQSKAGTKIEVTGIHPGIASKFRNTHFRKDLVTKLESVYALFLKCGLRIEVNGVEVKPGFPEFASSKELTPGKKTLRVDGIQVLLLAGMTPKGDHKPHGWYVFCNGRMVLEADKGPSTGWGTEAFPAFHTKYNHFLGMVYFKSNEAEKLPWKTTKDDVNRDSVVYQNALREMRIIAKPILDSLSRMYSSELSVESAVEHEVLKTAEKKSVSDLASQSRDSAFKLVPPRKSAASTLESIQYKRSKAEIKKVKAALGNPRMASKKMGEKTFEYYLRKECDQ